MELRDGEREECVNSGREIERERMDGIEGDCSKPAGAVYLLRTMAFSTFSNQKIR